MIYLLALAFGAAFSFGLAPFGFWPATILSIVGLYGLLRHGGVGPIRLAWCYGIGKYAVGASWVYVSIHVHGNAPVLLAGCLTFLFVAGLALLFCAPIGWLYARLKPLRSGQPTGGTLDVLAFSFAWVFMDWISTWLFTGFPWLLPGQVVMALPLGGWLSVVGVLGTGALLVLGICALVDCVLLRRAHWGSLLILIVPWIVGGVLLQQRWVEPGEKVSVALVQGNLDQATKWLPEYANTNVQKHVDLSAQHWDADLILWPEASVTLFPQQAARFLDRLDNQANATDTNLVVGQPGVEVFPGGRYQLQNLASGYGLASGRYAKHHLVPFGEYVPLESVLRGAIEFFNLPMSANVPGAYDQPNLKLSFGQAAMAICYEIAYPESMRYRAEQAALLMTISNDTWFGASIGPLQHLQLAQARAVENGRWLIRATNNGVTAIVNSNGVITAQLPQFEAGVLRGEVRLVSGRTPYSYVGHWPLLAYLFIIGGVALIMRLRTDAGHKTG